MEIRFSSSTDDSLDMFELVYDGTGAPPRVVALRRDVYERELAYLRERFFFHLRRLEAERATGV